MNEIITETHLPNLLHRGKVRDTYDLGEGLLLMVATDRISAFDVVLPNGIPDKGMILSRLSSFWFNKTAHLIPNHLVALAEDQTAHQQELTDIPLSVIRRAMVVKRAQRIDIECIVRGHIAGSAWAEYQQHGTIFGDRAPSGLQQGDKLDRPLFTPTTKAETGHDTNMTLDEVKSMVGEARAKELEEKSIAVYEFAREYAARQGIIIADTKMEFGVLGDQLILIDELLTPDSSRFWDAKTYSPGKSQPNFDKQFVRDWLDSTGWDHEPPAPELPQDIVDKTRERYKEAYSRLADDLK